MNQRPHTFSPKKNAGWVSTRHFRRARGGLKRTLRSAGFTLIEVLLSLALMLVLLIGISYIFSTSAAAIGAGNTFGAMARNNTAAQPIVFDDFRNIVKDGIVVIDSRRVTQYLNAADAQSRAIGTYTLDNGGTTIPVIPSVYNNASHRVDIISFLAHGFYHRRSADSASTSYVSSTTGDDAFIQIGHAQLPTLQSNSSGIYSYYGPENPNTPAGTPPSVVGAYASDWVLLRTAILLRYPTAIPVDSSTGQKEIYYANSGGGYLENLTPLAYGTLDTATANNTTLGQSYYDMAGITIEQFRRLVATAVINQNSFNSSAALNPPTSSPANGTEYPLWCAPLLYQQLDAIVTNSPMLALQYNYNTSANITNAANTSFVPQYDWTTGFPLTNRFQANPLLSSPLTTQNVAQMAPYFVEHCSQFIVEYAGDYLSQDNNPTSATYGQILAPPNGIGSNPDGQVDYFVDSQGYRHIRWYGMPRKTTISPTTTINGIARAIAGYDPGTDTLANTAGGNDYQDVIPLSDYLSLLSNVGAGTPRAKGSFEVDCNFLPCADYAGTTAANTFVANSRYACAWHNDCPSMIRILMKVDDPNNQVSDGPWVEFVFQLK